MVKEKNILHARFYVIFIICHFAFFNLYNIVARIPIAMLNVQTYMNETLNPNASAILAIMNGPNKNPVPLIVFTMAIPAPGVTSG